MPREAVPISSVFRELLANPGELFLRKWNWKSALLSSILRALIFLVANLTAGWRAAAGATIAEFIFRAAISGFMGSFTQAFRTAEPEGLATLTVLILLPLISHSLELAVHMAIGTPRLASSMISSVIFTEVSILFNLYAMRRGALVVGEDSSSMGSDLQRIPGLIGGFLISLPMALARLARREEQI